MLGTLGSGYVKCHTASEQKSLSMDSGHPYVIHVCFLTAKICKNTFAFFDYAHY